MSFFPLSDQRCFFLLEECGGMTEISVYVTVAYFDINCSAELVLRHQEDWLDI